jgi:hypothetical protein
MIDERSQVPQALILDANMSGHNSLVGTEGRLGNEVRRRNGSRGGSRR